MEKLKLNINPNDLKLITCDSCGHALFDQKMIYKEVPALLSGTGKPQLITVPAATCAKCGEPSKRFLTSDVIENLKLDED